MQPTSSALIFHEFADRWYHGGSDAKPALNADTRPTWAGVALMRLLDRSYTIRFELVVLLDAQEAASSR